MRTEGPRRLRPCEGACLCAGEVPEYRGWAGVSGSIFCVPQRSDVVAVVEIGWVQAVVMPLAPLLDGLPASLFLFWGQEMKSLCEDGGLGSGHTIKSPQSIHSAPVTWTIVPVYMGDRMSQLEGPKRMPNLKPPFYRSSLELVARRAETRILHSIQCMFLLSQQRWDSCLQKLARRLTN